MIQARIRKRFAERPDASAFFAGGRLPGASGVTVLFRPQRLGQDPHPGRHRPALCPRGRPHHAGRRDPVDASRACACLPQRGNCGYVFQNTPVPHMPCARPGLRRRAAPAPGSAPQGRRDARALPSHEVAGPPPRALAAPEAALLDRPRPHRLAQAAVADEPASGLTRPCAPSSSTCWRQVAPSSRPPFCWSPTTSTRCVRAGRRDADLREGGWCNPGSPRAIAGASRQRGGRPAAGQSSTSSRRRFWNWNPQRNLSRRRCGEVELAGYYFPAGCAATACGCACRPERLGVFPREANPARIKSRRNSCAPSKCADRGLEFAGGIQVEAGPPRVRETRN